MRIIEKSILLDRQTIKDLELNKIENKFNICSTSYGQRWFKERLYSRPEVLDSTRQHIRHTREIHNLETSMYSQKLNRLGRQRRGDIFRDLSIPPNIPNILYLIIPIWVVLFPALIFASVLFLQEITFWVVVFGIVTNFLLFYFTNNSISQYTGSLLYLIETIKMVKGIQGDDLISRLLPPVKPLEAILRYKLYINSGFSSSNIGLDMFNTLTTSLIDYLRIFFCMELYSFIKTQSYIEKNRGLIDELLYSVGYIDGLLNIKTIRVTYPTTEVIFSDQKGITFTDLRHPLLENPTPQSFELTKSIIITGMNMAGKSTFLKSIAINQIFSLSFGFAFAKQFMTSDYSVITSMKIDDDITRNMSRYYVEAERLLEIQERVKSEKLLCFIDEVLSGTNSRDRIDASSRILLNYAGERSSIILASTHDDELAHKIDGSYNCHYFDGIIDKNRISYDYQIKNGVVNSSNAINILKNIGVSI